MRSKMSKDVRKMLTACFVSGAMFAIVAFVFLGTWMWSILGAVAGFGAGYLAYDLRQVWQSIPIACRLTMASCLATGNKTKSFMVWLREWSTREHPFFYFVLLLGVICYYFLMQLAGPIVLITYSVVVYLAFEVFFFFISVWVGGLIVGFLAVLGAREEDAYWAMSFGRDAGDEKRFIERELREVVPTYRVLTRWIIKGLVIVTRSLAWDMWKYTVVAWAVFCIKLVLNLIILIHRRERVVYAIFGTLGGYIFFVILAPQVESIEQNVLVVLFSGLAGVAVGAFEWLAVGIRISTTKYI